MFFLPSKNLILKWSCVIYIDFTLSLFYFKRLCTQKKKDNTELIISLLDVLLVKVYIL
jgi:hypothetical protein